MTNREVAGALVRSPKTVEAHLARAYQKLGIASRRVRRDHRQAFRGVPKPTDIGNHPMRRRQGDSYRPITG